MFIEIGDYLINVEFISYVTIFDDNYINRILVYLVGYEFNSIDLDFNTKSELEECYNRICSMLLSYNRK